MKNAYCILAHNEPEVLRTLISLLDDENNDIYIHLDKKACCFDVKSLTEAVKMSYITFIPRRNIGWGGQNMIKAELDLLYTAIQKPHDYYHILSGVDLPLCSVKKTNNFLEINKGHEFIGVTKNWADSNAVKVRYTKYYFLQDYIGKKKIFYITFQEDLLEYKEVLALLIDPKDMTYGSMVAQCGLVLQKAPQNG